MSMQGYYTKSGFMGYVPEERRYVLFATDSDYYEYMKAHENPD